MGESTAIEWATHTFNPWIGCTKVSPACDHCYAEAYAARYKRAEWGAGKPRSLTSDKNWNLPFRWARKARRDGTRPRVFCSSLADVFDTEVPQAWRDRLWDLIEATPELDWLLLTKRPHVALWARSAGGLPWRVCVDVHEPAVAVGAPWPNVWLGTTVEDQRRADVRVPQLLEAGAALSFISMEPLLQHVSLDRWFGLAPGNVWRGCDCDEIDPSDRPCLTCEGRLAFGLSSGVDWVIVGGESGPEARPMDPSWARSLRDSCEAAGVPFMFKQWGEWAPVVHHSIDAEYMTRVGKKAAGRKLDGKTWDGIPNGEKR